jgi:hypothetical protein
MGGRPHVCLADEKNNNITILNNIYRFNIYIYDYCNKRGFRNTAQALAAEAGLDQDAQPPINAKQGLLFE